MSTGNRYSDEFRNHILELNKQGILYKKLSKQFGITISTISYWKNNINTGSHDGLIEQIINDPLYDIRDDGTIWTLKNESGKQILTTWRQCDKYDHKNYKLVKYNGKNLKVHRVIYRKFKGQLNANLEINHIDGKHDNNKPDNLELVTGQQNIKHSVENKLHHFGEKQWNSILTEDIVRQIKHLYFIDNIAQITISRKLKLNRHMVGDICRGKTWKHIKV